MPYILSDSGLQFPSNTLLDIYDNNGSYTHGQIIMKGIIYINPESSNYHKNALTLVDRIETSSNTHTVNLSWDTNIPSPSHIFSVYYTIQELGGSYTFNLTFPEGKYIFYNNTSGLSLMDIPPDLSYAGVEGNSDTLQLLNCYKEGEVFTTSLPPVGLRYPCFNIVGKRIE